MSKNRTTGSRDERQAGTRRTRRRWFAVAGVGVAVVLAAGIGVGIGAGLAHDHAPSDQEAGPVVPAHTSGDGSTIVYGARDAVTNVDVYEDMRCPFCAKFEKKLGPELQSMADSGKVKITFHMAAFLDGSLGGQGSKTSLAALGAALDESPKKFKAYHDVLFAHQPEESADDFGNTATLRKLADQVPGLRTSAFDKAVTEGTYLPWAAKVADAFTRSGVQGTPTVTVHGRSLTVVGDDGEAVSPRKFRDEVDDAVAAASS